MKFRKKPVVVEATQWRWLGDHPQVVDYRWVDGDRVCVKCALMMKRHGWIRTLDGGDIVHPGDWIVPDEDGEGFFRAIEEPFFEMEYESVEPWVEGFEAENAVCKREWIEDAVVERDRVGEILYNHLTALDEPALVDGPVTRFRVTVTCSCGAFLEADSHSEAHVQSVYREWAESHARCGSAVSRRYPIRPVPPPPYEDVDIRGDYTWSN